MGSGQGASLFGRPRRDSDVFAEQLQAAIEASRAGDTVDAEHLPEFLGGAALIRTTLAKAFNDSKYVQDKIEQLQDHYLSWRRVRGDGNCYYRAVGYALFELVAQQGAGRDTAGLDVGAHLQRALERVRISWASSQAAHAQLLAKLVKLRQCGQWGDSASGGAHDASGLHSAWLHDGTTDAAVVRALRWLTADFLRAHANEATSEGGLTWEQTVVAQGPSSLEQFVNDTVLREGVEAEGVILSALPLALQVPTRIVLLQKEIGVPVQPVDFPCDDAPRAVHVLHVPGHYDLLYPGVGAEALETAEAQERAEEAEAQARASARQREAALPSAPPLAPGLQQPIPPHFAAAPPQGQVLGAFPHTAPPLLQQEQMRVAQMQMQMQMQQAQHAQHVQHMHHVHQMQEMHAPVQQAQTTWVQDPELLIGGKIVLVEQPSGDTIEGTVVNLQHQPDGRVMFVLHPTHGGQQLLCDLFNMSFWIDGDARMWSNGSQVQD